LSDSDLQEKKSKETSEGAESNADKDRKSLRWLGFGFEFAGVIAIFTWLGHKADQKLGNEGPWLLLTGFGLGFVGMMYLLFKETFHLRK
jgi:apolipoprotein N-acyltransferase